MCDLEFVRQLNQIWAKNETFHENHFVLHGRKKIEELYLTHSSNTAVTLSDEFLFYKLPSYNWNKNNEIRQNEK